MLFDSFRMEHFFHLKFWFQNRQGKRSCVGHRSHNLWKFPQIYAEPWCCETCVNSQRISKVGGFLKVLCFKKYSQVTLSHKITRMKSCGFM